MSWILHHESKFLDIFEMATLIDNFKLAHPEELGPEGSIRVCIGGGAGFIGSHLAKRLRSEVSEISNI